MKLTEICINKPVFATVLSLVIILFGVMGYFNLQTRYFPNVDQHVIQIYTEYDGASAKLIESAINDPIENAVSSISGIDSLTSEADQDTGTVVIKFNVGVNFSDKANEVRDKLAAVRYKLPDNIKPPTVKVSDHSNFLAVITFSDPNMTSAQSRDYIERYVLNKIQEIPGVGNVETWGSNRYAMRIWLNPEKMAANKITVSDIKDALTKNNIQSPAGEFKSSTMDFPITEDTMLHSTQEFNNLIIANRDNNFIRVKDIGYAALGIENDPFQVQLDDKPVVGMDVYLEAGANPIEASKNIYQTLNNLKQTFPPGLEVKVPIDMSVFFNAAVHEVYVSILLAVLCVLAVIFLFLGSLRSVLIPVVTIPICVIGAFGIISLLGFSINLLTLLAIVLSVGLVVDDAIVMLENIYRHIEHGLSPYSAAIKGGKEIAFAVIAMSLTLIAVYAPIGFMQDRTAVLFREFAFTLAGAVLISGFVALTLSPSMCALFLLKKEQHGKYAAKLDIVFDWLRNHYQALIKKLIDYRLIVIIIALLLALVGFLVFKTLGKEFIPKEDMGMVVGSVAVPTGSNVDYTFKKLNEVEKVNRNNPAIDSIFGKAETEQGIIFFKLKPQNERQLSAQDVAVEATQKAQDVPGVSTYFSPMSFFSGMLSHGLELEVMTSGSYDELHQIVNDIISRLKSYPGLTNIDTSMKFDSQQFNMDINRDLANSVGVDVENIDDTLATLLGGAHITDFYVGDQSYEVIVQAPENEITQPSVVDRFYVKNTAGNIVPLNSLISINPILTQLTLEHYDRLRSAEITAELNPDYRLSDIVSYLQGALPGWLPVDAKYAFEGMAKRMLETGSSMNLIFLLALIFIYLILAAQFESFIDPFIILLTVPLSVVGGLIGLKLAGGTLNLYTEIGLVTLVGLITKHGILITKFANELCASGLAIKDAVIKAASIRLRPILMTTGAMVLGAIPLALATGSGSNSRSQIGWVIISGLLFGTFFSLVLVPIAYTYLARFKKK